MKRFSFLCLLLTLTGCSLNPPMLTPNVDIPEGWRETNDDLVDQASADCNLEWWTQFGDPVLNDYIQYAVANNRDLKRAIWRVEEARALYGVASSNLYPQISGNLQAARQEVSQLGSFLLPGQPRIYNFYSALLNASYELDIFGRIRSGSQAAFADFLGQIETKRTVILNLVSNVATSYIQIRLFDLQIEIAKLTLESREEAFRINTLRFEGGLTSELEVKQAESQVQDALAAIIDLERGVHYEENRLSILLGDSPHYIDRGLILNDFTKPFNVPAGLPSEVINNRPDLRMALDDLYAANARVGEAKAAFFPEISLTGDYGSQSIAFSRLFTGPARTWFFAGNLMQPIFNGYRIQSLTEAAKAVEYQAVYAYELAIQTAFREVNDALIALKKAQELEAVQTKQVQVLDDYLKLATLQYENGQSEYLNVLDAQRQLFESRLAQAEAKGQTFISLVNIYKALGGGWVQDLEPTSYGCGKTKIAQVDPNCRDEVESSF